MIMPWRQPANSTGIRGAPSGCLRFTERAAPEMEIKVTQASRATVVAPEGDLDAAAGAEMKRTLTDVLDKGHARLVVDLGRVSYIESMVWGELVVAAKRAREAGGELRLCAVCGDLLAIFTMTRLSQVMAVYPMPESAMAFEGER